MSPSGGKREGAGRPIKPDEAKHKPRRIYLTDDEYAAAVQLGQGNASEGVRRALANERQR